MTAYSTDYIVTCWPLIVNAIDAMERQSILHDAQRRIAQLVDISVANKLETVDHPGLTSAVEMAGRMVGLRGEEWLRQTYLLRTVPRSKPPPPTDLQIRLKTAVNAKRVLIESMDCDFRATVITTQGDVVVCRGQKMQWALDGALGMACLTTPKDTTDD